MTCPSPRFLAVGRIGRAHGVRGEVLVDVLTDFPDRFRRGARFFVGPEMPDPGPDMPVVTLLEHRPHRERLLATFDVASDRSEASQLTGMCLFIAADEARELEDGSYYIHQLVGLTARTVEGEDLGRVASLIETGSADVLVIEDGTRSRLVPMLAEVVVAVDLSAGTITIAPLPGLFD